MLKSVSLKLYLCVKEGHCGLQDKMNWVTHGLKADIDVYNIDIKQWPLICNIEILNVQLSVNSTFSLS